MSSPPFAYHRPTDLAEAVELLGRLQDEAKVLAGGQSLIPMMNLRLVRPQHLVDINRLPGLDQITANDGTLSIGCLTRHRALELSKVVWRRCPLLARAASLIGNVPVRHRGTIGGSLSHADPAAELPAALLALEGRLRLHGPAGDRWVNATDFFLGPCMSVTAADELLVEVAVPSTGSGTGWSFQELAPRLGDYAVVGVAVLVWLAKDGRIQRARIAMAGVGSTPLRTRQAEAALQGRAPSAALLAEVAAVAAEDIDPPSDAVASRQYRQEMARVWVRRTLEDALSRVAEGGEL